jgi:hypothetical protein
MLHGYQTLHAFVPGDGEPSRLRCNMRCCSPTWPRTMSRMVTVLHYLLVMCFLLRYFYVDSWLSCMQQMASNNKPQFANEGHFAFHAVGMENASWQLLTNVSKHDRRTATIDQQLEPATTLTRLRKVDTATAASLPTKYHRICCSNSNATQLLLVEHMSRHRHKDSPITGCAANQSRNMHLVTLNHQGSYICRPAACSAALRPLAERQVPCAMLVAQCGHIIN